jgi:succinoglycan biosynthesis protein ExoM
MAAGLILTTSAGPAEPAGHDRAVRRGANNPLTRASCTLSIIVCTYQRPVLLAACLRSCLQQAVPPGDRYEIIVVDNDAAGSAAAIVDALDPAGGVALRYFTEPVANIALARNRGVREAGGVWVAFIDDDFVLPDGWLIAALRALRDSRADVLLGDVRPVFEGGSAPAGVVAAFTRQAPETAGLVPVQRSGYIPGARSGNAVLRREFCFREGEGWFDPAFGRSGGEDSEFFLRLGRRRPRIIASSDAFVFDFVPASRQSTGYLLARARREGRNYARLVLKNAPHPRLRAIDLAMRGLIQIVLVTLLLSVAAFRAASPERRLALRLRRALATGKAMLAGAAKDEPYR